MLKRDLENERPRYKVMACCMGALSHGGSVMDCRMQV